MRLDPTVVKSLCATASTLVAPNASEVDGLLLEVHYLEDMAITYRRVEGEPVFWGLLFTALGHDFSVLPNYTLLINGRTVEEPRLLLVEDEKFMKVMERYMLWRTEALRELAL